MPHPSENHRQTRLISGGNHFIVPDGAAWLDYRGRTAIAAQAPEEVASLEQAGADLVLMPFVDAAREAADRIVGHDIPEQPVQIDQ